jgi:hypothetical protein
MPTESRSISQSGITRTISSSSANPTGSTSLVTEGFLMGNLARTSVRTPGYPLLKAIGHLPENVFGFSQTSFTPYIGRKIVHTQTLPNTAWARNDITGRISSFWGTPEPWSGSYIAAVMANQTSIVTARLNKRIVDSDIDLSVLAGEFRETAAMFGDLSKRLLAAKRAAGRGDARGVATALSMRNSKDWANLWLMVNYGIRPFVNDLLGASKALQKGLIREQYYLNHARTSFDDSITTVTGSVGSGQTTRLWQLRIETSSRCKYYVEDPYLATLSSLGLANPFSTAWELAKLSFVLDWAIGIGDWLSQLNASFGKRFGTGSSTTFVRVVGKASLYQNSVGPNLNFIKTSAMASYERVACSRNSLSSWPISYLPAFKDPASFHTIVTSLALLRQQRK